MKIATDNTKSAIPLPVANKAAKSKIDDDAENLPLVPPTAKPGFFPTGLSRAIVVGALIMFSAMLAANFIDDRYSIIATNNTENTIVFRLDKLSGTVSLCTSLGCKKLDERTEN